MLRSLVVVVAACGLAAAQELEIAVSPQPVGSGARAAGMADAFVAIADDATAASWNPAGLVQLERPELSIVGSYNSVYEKLHAPFHPELSSSHDDQNVDLNYFSFVYPLPVSLLGRNATVSLNYQRKYDFSRDFTAPLNTASVSSRGRVSTSFQELDFKQSGGLSTLTPAFAVELTKRLSVGVAFNLWRSSLLSENGWEQTIKQNSLSFVGSSVYANLGETKAKYEDFSGENVTLGLLWDPNYKWSVGLRYDSAFTGDADYKLVGANVQLTLPRLGSRLSLYPTSYVYVRPSVWSEKREVRFPASFAVGVAYRPNDRLTLSLDVTRTDWQDFYVKTGGGVHRSLVDFSNLDDLLGHTDFDPTTTVRFGLEHVFIPKEPDETLPRLWTLRGGLFYDEEPATGMPTGFRMPWDFGDGKPESFYGAAVGLGLLVNQRVNLDVAYQIRYGDDVNRDFLRGVKGFSEDVVQHRVLVSTVIYF